MAVIIIIILAGVISLVTVYRCKRRRRTIGDCQSNLSHPYAMNGPSVDSDVQQVTPQVRLSDIQEETSMWFEASCVRARYNSTGKK